MCYRMFFTILQNCIQPLEEPAHAMHHPSLSHSQLKSKLSLGVNQRPTDPSIESHLITCRQRTDEDIQRDYDAAGGPPTKAAPPSAPSAPPAPDSSRDDSDTTSSHPGTAAMSPPLGV